ncbi:MAG TPA: thioredoxin domain-containing protein [Chloroflexota bacterium]
MRWLGALTLLVLVGCSKATPAPPVATTVPTPSPIATAAPVIAEPRTPTGEYFLGRADAPVTLEMFGDFQCPVCGEFARSIEPPFVQKYVETGKVKFVWRDYTWIGDESFAAAEAARCAGEQGHFWAYHDYLFAHQHGENLGDFSDANLRDFAADLGLEPTGFAACLSAGRDLPAIHNAVSYGVSQGVDVTPSFLINGDLKVGAPPLNRLSALMEYYLARTLH